MPAPSLSLILCTYNPRPDLLGRTLDAIAAQAFPKDRYELIVVDNNSTSPLTERDINPSGALPARLVREPRQGLALARRCGILESRADLLVFVDDDNFLAPNYLQLAAQIAADNSTLGAFGGITRGQLEGPVPKWKRPLLPFLGIRDYGPHAITSGDDRWGPWEPIGAGMVVRRSVAMLYCQTLNANPFAQKLDRSGDDILSGSDSLLARCAYRLDLACSYQPALQLDHFIKCERMQADYLRRLLVGHGRSYVLLHRALGKRARRLFAVELFARLPWRLIKHGRCGRLWWEWDRGYYLESSTRP